MPIAEALLFYARRDQAQLDLALADSEAVSLDFVRSLYKAVEAHMGRAAEGRAGEARLVRMFEAVLQHVHQREGGSRVSADFLQLRQLAGVVVAGGLEDTEALEDFRTLLGRMLDVTRTFIVAVDIPRLIRLAGQVREALSEQYALDCARLSLLAWVLKHRKDGAASGGVDYDELRSIASILGGADSTEVDVARRLRSMGEHLAEQDDFDAGELPDLLAFQSMFNDLTNRADPATLAEMGLDPEQLDRSMAALESMRDAAGPKPASGGRRRPPAAQLLGRLAAELGLPAAQLVAFDTPDLLDRLPEVELPGGLSGGATARVRMMCLLVGEAKGQPVTRTLLDAFARKYSKNRGMLGALGVALRRTGNQDAASVLDSLMGAVEAVSA